MAEQQGVKFEEWLSTAMKSSPPKFRQASVEVNDNMLTARTIARVFTADSEPTFEQVLAISDRIFGQENYLERKEHMGKQLESIDEAMSRMAGFFSQMNGQNSTHARG